MHDTGLIKQGLAALRHHNAKRKKIKAKTVVKEEVRKTFAVLYNRGNIKIILF